ncbi:MAG: T9SS type A sorting domain-containing protein, partial [Bacteroidetes bacterium]|nr:T9SS type A sorting domain-containing protein [Bacteroidota bacterium]
LTSGVEYHFAIYKYNDADKCYNTTLPATGNATTTGTCSYCPSIYSKQTDDWITNVTFNTINNNSEQDGTNSYGDYTAQSTDVVQNSSYNLSVSFTSSGYTEHVWAWFDWNQNCDFNDAGEAYDLGDGIDATLTLSISIPASASLGTTRMRIVEKYNTDPSSCNSGTYGETEDYTINVTSSGITPTATISTTPGCFTGTVRVSSDLTGTQTFYLYNSDGTTEIANSGAIDATYYDFTGQSNGIYTGKVDKAGNMSNLSSQVTLTNLNNPTASTLVTATQTVICSDSSTCLSYTGGSGTTFGWYTASCGGTSVGTGNNLTVSPTTTTTYYGRWENSCGNSTCETVEITVNIVDVSVTENGITLTANAIGVSYQWIDCNNNMPITGETNISFTPTVNGDYAVIVNDGICSDTSMCYNVIVNSISEIQISGVKIFPNPTTGKITIEGINIEMIEVLNIEGQIIEQIEVEKDKTDIDLSSLSKGVYFVKVITNKGIEIKKIVVE